MDCKKEIWLPYPGYEGFYEVSESGLVRSISRLTDFGERKKFVKGRILKIKRRKNKYPFVILSKENKQQSCMIHRLVAETHIPNPNNFPCINHKDGNKENNDKSNLEWCSYSHNILHSLDNGLCKRRKLTKEDVLKIRSSSLSDIKLASIFGVRPGNIWNIKKRKSWKHCV